MPHNRWMPRDRLITLSRATTALVVSVAVMLLVAALGEWVIVPAGWVQDVDAQGVETGTGLVTDHAWLFDAATLWAFLSGPWCVHPFLAVVVVALWWRRRITLRAGTVVVMIAVIGMVLGAICKEIVDRPRPVDAVVHVGGSSYPSGHSTNIALWAVLICALAWTARAAWIRWGTAALAALGVVTTGLDRILLGVHNISDVVVGLGFGATVAVIGLTAMPLAPPAPARPSEPTPATVHSPGAMHD